MLRDRSEVERCSVNRLVNDGMRDYLARRLGAPVKLASGEEGRQILAGLGDHLLELEDVLDDLNLPQEDQKDFNNLVRVAFKQVKGLLAVIAAAADPSSVPTVSESARDRVHA